MAISAVRSIRTTLPAPRVAPGVAVEVAGWLLLLVLVLGIFVLSWDSQIASSKEFLFQSGDGSAQLREQLDHLGITPQTFALAGAAIWVMQSLLQAALSFLILVKRQSRDWFAFWISCVLLANIGAVYPPDIPEWVRGGAFWHTATRLTTSIAITGLILMPLLFPTGSFLPRLLGLVGGYVALTIVGFAFFPESDNPILTAGSSSSPLDEIALVVLVLSSMIYRYRWRSDQIQRQQLRIAGFGLGLALPAFLLGDFMMQRIGSTSGGVLAYFGFTFFMALAGTIVPLSLTVAILRYRLFEIHIVLNRVIVYTILTGLVIVMYAAIVLGLGTLLRERDGLAISLVATGVIAVAFQPVRELVQRVLDRAFFGQRDNPYAVTAELGRELERVVAAEEILPAVTTTLTRSLHLPYAAVEFEQQGESRIAAASGEPVAAPVRFPLIFQGEQLGHLVVGQRAPDEPLGPADGQLLENLARQIGVAAHAVQTTEDLRLARWRLVATREEERRRLRRDLHDGLGSQLAALSMQANAIRATAQSDPAQTAIMATELSEELRTAIGDIRRLVHGLRPPSLDELGLLEALRARGRVFQASHGNETSGVEIGITAPDQLPVLPASVEVAIYRIVEEALTNVIRHSGASHCQVEIVLNGQIMVTIRDDGRGANHNAWGVGFASIRERAEELGGSFRLTSGLQGKGLGIEVSIPGLSLQPEG